MGEWKSVRHCNRAVILMIGPLCVSDCNTPCRSTAANSTNIEVILAAANWLHSSPLAKQYAVHGMTQCIAFLVHTKAVQRPEPLELPSDWA